MVLPTNVAYAAYGKEALSYIFAWLTAVNCLKKKSPKLRNSKEIEEIEEIELFKKQFVKKKMFTNSINKIQEVPEHFRKHLIFWDGTLG